MFSTSTVYLLFVRLFETRSPTCVQSHVVLNSCSCSFIMHKCNLVPTTITLFSLQFGSEYVHVTCSSADRNQTNIDVNTEKKICTIWLIKWLCFTLLPFYSVDLKCKLKWFSFSMFVYYVFICTKLTQFTVLHKDNKKNHCNMICEKCKLSNIEKGGW